VRGTRTQKRSSDGARNKSRKKGCVMRKETREAGRGGASKTSREPWEGKGESVERRNPVYP